VPVAAPLVWSSVIGGSAAAVRGGRFRVRPGGGRAAGAALLFGQGVGVGLDDVDLPRFVAGAVDLDLVLHDVAAGGVVLHVRCQALVRESGGGHVDGFCGFDLDAEVVHPCGLALGAFDQDELQRGFGDGEVGVSVAEFGGFGAEQLAIEAKTEGRRPSSRAPKPRNRATRSST
jgi:hypothetical protein